MRCVRCLSVAIAYSTHSRPFQRQARISAVGPKIVIARALCGSPWIAQKHRPVQDVAGLIHERAFAREHPRAVDVPNAIAPPAVALAETRRAYPGTPLTSRNCMRFSNWTVRSTVVPVTTPLAPISSRAVWMASSPTNDNPHVPPLADRRFARRPQRVHRLLDPGVRLAHASRNAGDTMIAIAASVPRSATTTSTSSRVKPASLRRVDRESPACVGSYR